MPGSSSSSSTTTTISATVSESSESMRDTLVAEPTAIEEGFILPPSSRREPGNPERPAVGLFRFNTHYSIYFPNIPAQPVNGMIKSFPGPNLRTFSRPYSAKTVFFYKDGDEYFTGVRVPISKARYRTMNSLMDSLNDNISLPFGVRRLHTPYGRTSIHSIEQLEHLGRYVASSSKPLRRINIDGFEKKRLRRWKPVLNNTQTVQEPQTSSVNSSQKVSIDHKRPTLYKARMAVDTGRTGNNFLPITAKQMFFVLNGHPTRIYRTLINPLKPRDFDSLLEEISQGLQTAIFKLYSYDGERIWSVDQLVTIKEARALAVPRHERPILTGEQAFILPPIGKNKSSRASTSSQDEARAAGRFTAPVVHLKSKSTGANSRPMPHIPPHRGSFTADDIRTSRRAMAGTLAVNPGIPRQNDSMFRSKRATAKWVKPEAESQTNLETAIIVSREGDTQPKVSKKASTDDSGTAISPNFGGSGSQNGVGRSLPSTSNTLDSDSGRPRSASDDLLLADLERKTSSEYQLPLEAKRRDSSRSNRGWVDREGQDPASDDDYPEQPEALRGILEGTEGQWNEEDETSEHAVLDSLVEEDEPEEIQGNGELAEELESPTTSARARIKRLKTIEEMPESSRLSSSRVGDSEKPADDQINDYDDIQNTSPGLPVVSPQEELDETRDITPLPQVPSSPGMNNAEEGLPNLDPNQAATVIQANWRGYRVRKVLKKTQFNDVLEIIHPETEDSSGELDQLPIDLATPEHDRDNNTGVTEDLNNLLGAELLEMSYMEKTMDSSSDREGDEVHGTNYLVAEMGGLLEPSLSSEGLDKKPTKDPDVFTYSITIITGNRWAADTEADLYVILYGDTAQSDKLRLCQDYVNWLQSADPKFRQNQSDTFQVDLPTRLGVIGRLTVGHDHTGYGAGIFIDRILVTEENGNETQSGRQFLFLCNKWLDSGQVDGKIERNIRLSAFYDIGSLPTENQATKGRWELIIHSGNAKGEGGTTSSLSIIGYGTRGHSKTTDIYDSRMAKVPSEALIQVDFGDIGELLKIRLEVDGNGDSPDYFLNFVELKDLDTEEQFAVMCGKWLRWNSSEKGAQSFRELLAFHVGVEPLPLISYEGKLRLAPSKIQFTESLELRMELYGDLGETGFVRLFFDENNNNLSMNDVKDGKIDIPFKLESVSIGRVYGARLSFDPTPLGESIYEGLATLQEIYQRSLPDVQSFDTGNSWLVSHAILRESTHTPYRYVLKQNRVHRPRDQSQSCIKELLTTEMEGISTRVNKKKVGKRLESNWILSMAISDNSTFLPVVTLCGEKKVSMEMRNLDPTPTDNIISYQLKSSKVGALRKIRIAVGKEKLKVPPASQQTPNRSYAGDYVGIHKIRLCDTANGDELRFPSAEVDLFQHSVYEFSAIFPDQPPIPIVVYGIRVATNKSTVGQSPASDILIRLNLNGEMGDIGQRALVPDPLDMDGSIDIVGLQSSFKENAHANFELEAVSIGEISSAEVTVEWLKGGKHKELIWECEEIVVTDSNTSLFYAFKFPKPFTSKLTQQTTSVLPFLNAL